MPLNKQIPILWTPFGVTDSVDASKAPVGSMSSLKDLVHDPSTLGIFVPRPAAISRTDFTGSGISNPGFVSCLHVVGNIAYGMVSTDSPVGKDVPFVYEIDNDVFRPVTGYNAGNTPDSAQSTGHWKPPQMATSGVKVAVAHTGFDGVTNFVGFIDISNPALPTWSAGNTSPTALPGVPSGVEGFGGRAYYTIGNQMWFSDIILPDTITSATQVLIVGDTAEITGTGALPLSSDSGGIVEAMMVFKPKTIFQVVGDVANNTLKHDEVGSGIGCEAPLSISPTPEGLYFISEHGLRVIDVSGTVSDVIGSDGQGISVPFIDTATPSRIAGSFSINTMRITTTNQSIPSLPVQDWWYNAKLGAWTGPHSFPASLSQAWSSGFVMTPAGIEGELWVQDIVPTITSEYIENGNQMEFGFATTPLPLNQTMNQNAIVETSIGLQYSQVGGTINFIAENEDKEVLDSVSKTVDVTASFWDIDDWGGGNWGGDVTNYQQVRVPWSKPLVFSQMTFAATGFAVKGLKLGTISLRYQVLGYMVTP
jgi:hypothetical protein